MSKEIKEMAEVLSTHFQSELDLSNDIYEMAKSLYEVGYRKQSDTAKEFAEKLQQVIDKAEVVVQEMHSKYHLTFGAEQKAYSNAYNATVAIRECIDNLYTRINRKWKD